MKRTLKSMISVVQNFVNPLEPMALGWFSLICNQAKLMVKLIKKDWARHRGNETLLEIPKRFGYVQRLANIGRPASELYKKKARHKN